MVKNINQEVQLIYSPGYDCYYFRHIQSLFVSSQDYKTPSKALADFRAKNVIWVEDKNNESK